MWDLIYFYYFILSTSNRFIAWLWAIIITLCLTVKTVYVVELQIFLSFFFLFLFFNYRTLEANLQYVVSQCAVYFPKSATQEILDELLPRLQPLDIGKNCNIMELLSIFLSAMPHGHELWVYDMMDFWNTYQNPPWASVSKFIYFYLVFVNLLGFQIKQRKKRFRALNL